jgi:hypothetical protein
MFDFVLDNPSEPNIYLAYALLHFTRLLAETAATVHSKTPGNSNSSACPLPAFDNVASYGFEIAHILCRHKVTGYRLITEREFHRESEM